jgi:3-carboxy-cis,cis-muconate cycloisomerase
MEWTLVPDAASYSLSAIERALELVEGLEIHPQRMTENLRLSHQFVYAEAVMMALAPRLGRQKAHDLVDAAVTDARGGKSFVEALQQSEEISNILSTPVLNKILTGQAHIKAAAQEVREVLANCDRGQ